MDYIKLLSEKYNLVQSWSENGVTVLKGVDLFIQLIEPHHGTGFQYCMKAEFPETFDRWSVALFEEEFVNDGGFLQAIEALTAFKIDKINIINEVISKDMRLK
ncbi:hypothetical protein IFU39_16555 [Paenibacillus sp. CFBP 13594]|uniref:hypothetical protein n=1 Tax=Paenibacillus sp. CFBP 13594 TaxID=2774037 RepID=UPI001783AE08|nr:hypothetical protein [Paenibacillus sp. CFBP 13594]MBD8839425.1 hypothetical protein [Paenibacillus sp. CFBP 13594]